MELGTDTPIRPSRHSPVLGLVLLLLGAAPTRGSQQQHRGLAFTLLGPQATSKQRTPRNPLGALSLFPKSQPASPTVQNQPLQPAPPWSRI